MDVIFPSSQQPSGGSCHPRVTDGEWEGRGEPTELFPVAQLGPQHCPQASRALEASANPWPQDAVTALYTRPAGGMVGGWLGGWPRALWA